MSFPTDPARTLFTGLPAMDFSEQIPRASPNPYGWAESNLKPWTDKVMASQIQRQVNATDSPLVNPSANNSAFFLPSLEEEDRQSLSTHPLIDAIDKLLHANNQQALAAASARSNLPVPSRSWQPPSHPHERELKPPKYGPAYYMSLGQPAPQRERARSSPDPATLQFLEKEGLIFRQEAVNVPLTQTRFPQSLDRSRASSAASNLQESTPFHYRVAKTMSRSSTVDTLEIPSPAESSLGPSEFNEEEAFDGAEKAAYNDILARLAGSALDTSSLLNPWGTQKSHVPQPLVLPATCAEAGTPSPTNSDEPRKLNPAAKPWSPPAKTESPPPAPVRVREPTRITNLRKRLQRMEQTKQRLADGMTVDRRQMAALEHEAEVRYEISQWELNGILLRDEEPAHVGEGVATAHSQTTQAGWPGNATEWQAPNRVTPPKAVVPNDWFELPGQSAPPKTAQMRSQPQPAAPLIQRQLLADLLLKTLANQQALPKMKAPQSPIHIQANSPPSPSPAPVPVETTPSPIISPQLLERLLAVLEQPPALPVNDKAKDVNLPSPVHTPANVPLVPLVNIAAPADVVIVKPSIEVPVSVEKTTEEKEERTAVPEQPEEQTEKEKTTHTEAHQLITASPHEPIEDDVVEEVQVEEVVAGFGEEENHATVEDVSPNGDVAEVQPIAKEVPTEVAYVLSTPLMEATSVTEPIASGNPKVDISAADSQPNNAGSCTASRATEPTSIGSGVWKPLHIAPLFDLWRAIGALSLLVVPFAVIIMLFAEAAQ